MLISLYRGTSWISRRIQSITRSPYSHAAMTNEEDGKTWEAWHVAGEHRASAACPAQGPQRGVRQPSPLPERVAVSGACPRNLGERKAVKPYYQDDAVTLYHGDCREIVPTLGRFDLLLTDPPYGIGEARGKNKSRSCLARSKDYGCSDWDDAPPDEQLLAVIMGACEKQIIFGGNYYRLPPCKGPLVWDKENGANDFADGEMAWNNLGCAMRIKRHQWHGMIRKGNELREHPTQKPLDVIKWCIGLAGGVQTILDPFAGSGTTGRAAKDLGRKAVLIEREERYCEIAARRMQQEVLNFTEPAKEAIC